MKFVNKIYEIINKIEIKLFYMLQLKKKTAKWLKYYYHMINQI